MNKWKQFAICLTILGSLTMYSEQSDAKEVKKVDSVQSIEKVKSLYKVEKLTVIKKNQSASKPIKKVDAVTEVVKKDDEELKKEFKKTLATKYDAKEIEKELAENRKLKEKLKKEEKVKEEKTKEEKAKEEKAKEEKAKNKEDEEIKHDGEQGESSDWINPLPSMTISSGFGWREDPTGYSGNGHDGIDIPASFGQPVKVSRSGEVVDVGFDGSAGNYIIVSHDDDMYSYYLHLSEQLVSQGQQVKQGDEIGLVGSTGNSTGSHLHFGVARTSHWSDFIDPTTILPL